MAEILEQLRSEGADIAVVGYHSFDDYTNSFGEARIEYYGMVGLPHVNYDGEQLFNLTYDSMLAEYEEKIAINSHYTISIDVDRDGTSVTASIGTNQIGAPNPETKVLHLVLTESHIPESWYGGEEVNDVERLMVPDEHGTPFINGNTELEFEIDPAWLVQNCEIVAFIQDTISKEITQTQVLPLASTVLYNDVKLTEIINPSGDYCLETMSPVIEIENYGTDTLWNCTINYDLNGIAAEYNWEGMLSMFQTELITLPELSFNLANNNSIEVVISLPNGEEDEDPENNTLVKSFGISPMIDQPPLLLELKTDDFASETSWELLNELGETVQSGSGYDNNTLYPIALEIGYSACYSFVIYDEGGNGICCETGVGYYKISDNNGLVYFIGGDFGSQDIAMFQVDNVTSLPETLIGPGTKIYPNPVKEKLFIKNAGPSVIRIYDELNNMLMEKETSTSPSILDISFLKNGVYFFHIETGGKAETRKIIVLK